MIGSRWLLAAGLLVGAVPAQAADWRECGARLLILGSGSLPAEDGFIYWAALSNPGFGRVHWRHGFAVEPMGATQHLDAARQTRLELGRGLARLSPAEVASALVLRCLFR